MANLDWLKEGYRELKHTFWVPTTTLISLKIVALRGLSYDLFLGARTKGVDGTREIQTSLWRVVIHCVEERMVRQMEGSFGQNILIFPQNRIPIYEVRQGGWISSSGNQLYSGWSDSNKQLQISTNNKQKIWEWASPPWSLLTSCLGDPLSQKVRDCSKCGWSYWSYCEQSDPIWSLYPLTPFPTSSLHARREPLSLQNRVHFHEHLGISITLKASKTEDKNEGGKKSNNQKADEE